MINEETDETVEENKAGTRRVQSAEVAEAPAAQGPVRRVGAYTVTKK
jgi:hypothetical protein